jgi:hypothetical protein
LEEEKALLFAVSVAMQFHRISPWGRFLENISESLAPIKVLVSFAIHEPVQLP